MHHTLMPHVLIVEDDPDIAHFLQHDLQDAGYHTTTANSVLQGLTFAREHTPDLVLLDLGLPDGDGRHILTRLRSNTTTPVIILTARATTEEKVELLNLGANDYLAKPFDPRELLARIAVQLRIPSFDVLTLGDIELYPVKKLITCNGRELRLSPKEFQIFELLVRQPGRIFSRAELFEALWDAELNPIELVWAYIKWNVLGNFCARTLKELKTRLKVGWQRVRYTRLPDRLLHSYLPS